MTKSEFIRRLAEKQKHLPYRDVESGAKDILAQIIDALVCGERVEICGFGSFTSVFLPARMKRNPRTGDQVTIPDKHVIRFNPAKELRRRVNGIYASGE